MNNVKAALDTVIAVSTGSLCYLQYHKSCNIVNSALKQQPGHFVHQMSRPIRGDAI